MTDDVISILKQRYGTEFGADAVRAVADELGTTYATLSKKLSNFKVSRGKWNLEITQEKIDELEESYIAPSVSPVSTLESVKQNLIPEKDNNFVSFGNFPDIKKVIQSGLFYPVFITGLSGNGKTFSVEQSCATLNRELIRVNITIETDETDLIGGYTLLDGNTVWRDGPVVEAMEKGAILLLDECLEENEEILVGTVNDNAPMKLSDMEFCKEYPIVSFNMESGELENDFGSIISDKVDEIYEVELDDGRTIRLNSKHPFIVQMDDGKFAEKTILDGLCVGEEVVSFI